LTINIQMVGFIRNIILLISIFTVALLLPLICPASAANITTSRSVTISGSSTVMPLAEAAAEEFNLMQKDYVVTVSAGGTGAGILGIAERKNDIAMASRRITDEERQRFNGTFQEFPVGLDGISIAVSDEIFQAGVRGLSSRQVRKIYSGNISNWKEVGGPDLPIYVVSREEGSGTRDDFNELIMGSNDAETPGVDTVAMGAAEVKTAISGSDKAIGYLGFNYLGGGVSGISFNGIKPTYDNIKLDLYELHRRLYFYTYGEPSPGARAFIDFVLGPEGQRIAADEGFVPA
jgi:phosphate transport system substrate-binding protein